ncbi:MAG: SGNH/GDSL hydrolase family protein [Clostridia bacterium]|nr:SGNH/GDSL hydrolase family protein [Clostridia bacterium]
MVDYHAYQPPETARQRENIEWSITYSYNARNTAQRVLLIGDSICNAYQNQVRVLLEDTCNVSFWASSKCVTDPDYFRELDFILDGYRFDMVCFNNGLHSLTTDPAEWAQAYRAAATFIRAKCPQAALYLTLSTPLQDPVLTEKCHALNDIVRCVAAEMPCPVIDLFAPMDGRDRQTDWSDCYHFRPDAVRAQAEIIAQAVRECLGTRAVQVGHSSVDTGPLGRLK